MKVLLHMQVVAALVAVNIHGKVPVVLVETGVAAQVVMPTLEMEQRVLDDGGIELTMPLKLKSIAGHRNVIVPEENGMTLKQDAIIRAIHNSRRWTDSLAVWQAAKQGDFAKKLGLAAPYVTRILTLANLAPDIVEAVCSGCEPEGVSLARLVKGFPDDWVEQRMVMGFQRR